MFDLCTCLITKPFSYGKICCFLFILPWLIVLSIIIFAYSVGNGSKFIASRRD